MQNSVAESEFKSIYSLQQLPSRQISGAIGLIHKRGANCTKSTPPRLSTCLYFSASRYSKQESFCQDDVSSRHAQR